MNDSRWIELDGAVNVRDLGGLTVPGGGRIQPNRLIRADNLQALSDSDVRVLVDERRVRAIADLRTEVEVAAEGRGPMTGEPLVQIEHLSLFPASGQNTDAAALDEDAPIVLPWQNRTSDLSDNPQRGAATIYFGYLQDRSDSALAALRLIAHTDGATIVHCAAGKDRTGVVVALALAEVGVPREAIVADYALSAERIEQIFQRLMSSPTYQADLSGQDITKHRTRPETMQRLLAAIDVESGGVPAWLRSHGWTEDDGAALRTHLLQA